MANSSGQYFVAEEKLTMHHVVPSEIGLLGDGGKNVDQGINRKRSEQLINLSRSKYLRVLQYDATQFYICYFF